MKGHFVMKGDKRIFVEAGKAVDVFHHPRWTMEDLEKVSKKLLRPTANLVDGTVVFQNLLDGAAIAEPEEFRTPEEFPILTDRPATAASFTDKRMIMTFSLGTTAGAKANRAQSGAIHGKIKSTKTIRAKKSESDFGSVGIVWLHENPTHAAAGPISFEEAGKIGVVSRKTRRRGDGKFQFVPKMSERRCPHRRRDVLAVMPSLESAKRLHTDFEEGTIDVIKSDETDEGA